MVIVHFLCLSKENEPKEKTLFMRVVSILNFGTYESLIS